MYSFQEMISHKDYDFKELSRDTDIQERDNPIGWVVQRRLKNGKLIFVEVNENENFSFIEDHIPCSGNCKNCEHKN